MPEIKIELPRASDDEPVEVEVFFDLETDEEMTWSYQRDTISYRVKGRAPVLNGIECRVNGADYPPTPEDEKYWGKWIWDSMCLYANEERDFRRLA